MLAQRSARLCLHTAAMHTYDCERLIHASEQLQHMLCSSFSWFHILALQHCSCHLLRLSCVQPHKREVTAAAGVVPQVLFSLICHASKGIGSFGAKSAHVVHVTKHSR